jgi:general secretion pathway protein K
MLAAVAGISVFGFLALQVLTASRASVEQAAARIERAQLSADADAALALAVAHINVDPSQRWPINGLPKTVRFDSSVMVVRIQDDNGKVPINQLDDSKLRRLFQAVGVSGPKLDELVDSFMEWRNGDSSSPPEGPAAAYYAELGLRPRNGEVRTIEELIHMRGMNADILDKLMPLTTVYWGKGAAFDPSVAVPLAAAIMSDNDDDTSQGLSDEAQQQSEQPALASAAPPKLPGLSFNITIEVRNGSGAYLVRNAEVEITGDTPSAYWIRYLE